MNRLVIDNETGLVENSIVVKDDKFQLDGKTLLENTVGKVGDTYDFTSKIFTPEPEFQEDNATYNKRIDEELREADIKIIRALVEGDTVRINEHIESQLELREKKVAIEGF